MRCNLCKRENPGSCEMKYCPVFRPSSYSSKQSIEGKTGYEGQAPSVFVGEYGYPKVNLGLLGNENITSEYDDVRQWISKKFDINKIIDLRSSLLNSKNAVGIKDFNSRLMQTAQEVAMAKKPTDIDVNLLKKPKFDVKFSKFHLPHGPSAELKSAKITQNTSVNKFIEKSFYDTDLKASDALLKLSKKGLHENQMTKVFSVGMLGIKPQRKLVPTKWSITAVDDTIGKNKIDELKKYEFSEYRSFFGSYQGNYFLVLLFNQQWSYELFENHIPTLSTTTDNETYDGRKEYVKETAGGYYASRIAILEKLLSEKKQAGILVLRFITEEYSAPLGVWVVRQAVRDAMTKPLQTYPDWNSMIVHAISLVAKKFGKTALRMLQANLKNSKLLNNHRTQQTLSKYA